MPAIIIHKLTHNKIMHTGDILAVNLTDDGITRDILIHINRVGIILNILVYRYVNVNFEITSEILVHLNYFKHTHLPKYLHKAIYI